MRNPWMSLGLDAWMLGLEASSVIGLRTLKLAAGGPDAHDEATRMVQEKIEAGLAWQTKALSGGFGLTPASTTAGTLTHFRRKVRANQRRLAKG
jgi:hypothetical protein